MDLRGREIILGVGGGISAYKSADLIRRLQDQGFLVTVVPTRASSNFVGKATWEALSGRPVHDDLWSNVHSVPHIDLAKMQMPLLLHLPRQIYSRESLPDELMIYSQTLFLHLLHH